MSIFEDATHYIRSANALLPEGWEVYSLELLKANPEGYATAKGAVYTPYKCGGRAGSLSNHIVPKTRMTFVIPFPPPAAPLKQVLKPECITKVVSVHPADETIGEQFDRA